MFSFPRRDQIAILNIDCIYVNQTSSEIHARNADVIGSFNFYSRMHQARTRTKAELCRVLVYMAMDNLHANGNTNRGSQVWIVSDKDTSACNYAIYVYCKLGTCKYKNKAVGN